ncbi:MAG: hypothetical protein ABEJ91_04335 [Candidatus Nanohaloarchaea archaeon]
MVAVQSTASGINATLFGSSMLAHKVATEKELPEVFSFRNKRGIPVYALLIIGGLTALLTEFGSSRSSWRMVPRTTPISGCTVTPDRIA